MSMGPIQDEFQRQLELAQKIMAENKDMLGDPRMADQWTPEEAAKFGERDKDKPPITRNGDANMAAPSTIKNFAGTLRDHLKRATDRMEKMAGDFAKTVDNLHHRLDETDALKKDVDAAAAEIQQVIGTPNGGPPLEN